MHRRLRLDKRPQETPDEVLCALCASGDRAAEETLVLRYTRLVRICARPFFLAGGDSEDLIQEGMLGLLSAIREFDAEKEAAFPTYAEVCIRNRLISAIRAATRGKHTPLNSYISLEPRLFDQRIAYHADVRQQHNPEDMLIDRESLQERLHVARGYLSAFETEVLAHYLDGRSYTEIAQHTRRSLKSVDNAVQRIRRKLARQRESREL